MQCEGPVSDHCPCPLAAKAECSYCSLLGGEAFCRCDWRGWCAYERFRWPDAAGSEPAAGASPATR